MTDVYIGVGSNISPDKNIPEALRLLKEKVPVKATSSFYFTPPLDERDQHVYCNGVWKVSTIIEPYILKFDVLRQIESFLGRTRGDDRYASRPIDLDILIYGDRIVMTDDITIPDPGIYIRPFVCIPLLEIAPGLVIPDTGKSIMEVASGMDDKEMKPAYHITNKIRKGIDHG